MSSQIIPLDEPLTGNAPHEKSCKEQIQTLLETWYYQVILGIVTIYALFGEDFRLLLMPKRFDDVFFTMHSVTFAIFIVEMFLRSYADPKKYLQCRNHFPTGFSFWYDLIAALSILADIGWFWNDIEWVDEPETVADGLGALRMRAARSGPKAMRIIRVLRIIRLVRVLKLLKISLRAAHCICRRSHQKKRVRHHRRRLSSELAQGEWDVTQLSEIGAHFGQITTRRVMTVVLVMLFATPLLEGSFIDRISVENQGFVSGLELLHRQPQDLNTSSATFLQSSTSYFQNNPNLLYMAVCARGCRFTWPAMARMQLSDIQAQYRRVEVSQYGLSVCYDDDHQAHEELWSPRVNDTSACITKVVFDVRDESQFNAGTNILKTCFVMCIFLAFAIMFNQDAEHLVIRPIERMISIVESLAINPFSHSVERRNEQKQKKMATNQPMASPSQRAMQLKKKLGGKDTTKRSLSSAKTVAGQRNVFETKLVEEALTKIGDLLRIGFGEAGADIISRNMSNLGNVEVLLPGQKVFAIFGFCDICGFTGITECLQEDVMVFVNQIGKILHEDVHEMLGTANKNIGDAFLFVWKLPSDSERGELGQQDCNFPMGDYAVRAFLKCMTDISQSNLQGELSMYRAHSGIVEHYDSRREFKVQLGYGLHVGWAIEGAIGSKYKVDASYLSPHVNISSRLESATRHYGVSLLMSDSLFELLSQRVQRACRRVDRIVVKGASEPMTIYTFDYDLDESREPFACAAKEDDLDGTPSHSKAFPKINFASRRSFDQLLMHTELHYGVESAFGRAYDAALSAYLAGHWGRARSLFLDAKCLRPSDGPIKMVYEYMSAQNFKAPEAWDGYRVLDEK